MAHDHNKASFELKVATLIDNIQKATFSVDIANIIRAALLRSEDFFVLAPNLTASITYLTATEPILEKLVDTLLTLETKTKIQPLQKSETKKAPERFFRGEVFPKDSIKELNAFYNLTVNLNKQRKSLLDTTQKIVKWVNTSPQNASIMETVFKQLRQNYEQFNTRAMTVADISIEIYDMLTCKKLQSDVT